MKPRKQLTGRQAAFAEYYAMLGNGVRAAKLAGYRDGPGLRAVASRLARQVNICQQVASIRESAFKNLRKQISSELHEAIMFTLNYGMGLRRAQRAQRIAWRIGLYPHNPFARE
jgi:phage terminase small subunit